MAIVCCSLLSSSIFAQNLDENTQDAEEAPHREAEICFSYTPGSIYKIYCMPGYLTDVIFQNGEEINFIGGGDTTRWMIDSAKSGKGKNQVNHLYIKPVQRGIDTNLIVNTTRHSYHIQLVSTNTYNPIVSWLYPQEVNLAEEIKEKEKEDETLPRLNEISNTNYKIDGNKKLGWKPVTVFDDGEKTFIQMPASMKTTKAPVLYIKEQSKAGLALVNYRVLKNYYIVDRLFDEAEMKSGEKEIVKIKKLSK